MLFGRRGVITGMAGLAGTVYARTVVARSSGASVGDASWRQLKAQVGGRLVRVRSPLAACAEAHSAGAAELFKRIQNPYLLGDEAGLTQTLGWTDAWTSQPSTYAVVAENAADVAAAVTFARRHDVRLVVKGGGHSYFGNSNAAHSLLVWTRRMQAINIEPAFRPDAAPDTSESIPAVSIGAGAIWGRVYDTVAVTGDRYVQGGGCLTVGVAGFVSGGGFGSLSKEFGTGAGNLIEAEVVTADGRVRIANRYREPDLFFALRGGGGGTFGIITRLTLRTDPLPTTIGAAQLRVTARSDAAWRTLVARIIAFYATSLFNPAWGEQIRFSPGRKLSVAMTCHGLDSLAIKTVWQPFTDWLAARSGDYALEGAPLMVAVPARQFWDPAFLRSVPGVVLSDDRYGTSSANVFWTGNQSEAAQVLHAYQSAWLPSALLAFDRQASLADALVAAANVWSVTLHANKGMAGGTPEARARVGETATNSALLDAFALLICAAEGPPAWPGIRGHEPDIASGRLDAAHVRRAMEPIRNLVPGAGSYMSESDYFGTDWQHAYWGKHYDRLLSIKRRYDPDKLFVGHHTVGSS